MQYKFYADDLIIICGILPKRLNYLELLQDNETNG